MKIKYCSNKGSVVAAADIQRVAATLKAIEKRDGSVTAEAVFKEARSKKSVLHKYYQWDIEKAAAAHWLETSSKIIRAVCIVIEGDDEDTEPVRAFVSVAPIEGDETLEGRGYISIRRAMESPDYRRQVLEDAYAEIVSWRSRYERLKVFSNIFAAIDATAPPVTK